MNDIDILSRSFLEQAKRFLELATEHEGKEGEFPYCIAALLSGFSAVEAHVNAIAEELSERKGCGILEKSILLEKEFKLSSGKYALTKSLKMYRMDDRITFIVKNFSSAAFPPKENWWSEFTDGTKLRNDLVHPKEAVTVDIPKVRRALLAILELLEYLYRAVFTKGHPSYNRGLHSNLTF